MDKKLTIREQIKMMLLLRDVSLSKVIRRINKIHGSKLSQSNISHKLTKGTVKFTEIKEMAELLGYDLIFKERKDWEDWEE